MILFKGVGNAMRYEVDQMIQALGLEDKRHVLSKKLSGKLKLFVYGKWRRHHFVYKTVA